MKKSLLYVLLSVCLHTTALAQQGNNKLTIGVEAGFPTGKFSNYKTGVGALASLLFGVGTNGQITFNTGYTSFKYKGSSDDMKIKTNVIPFLVGYRYNASILFVEPRLGVGIYDVKTKIDAGSMNTTTESSKAGFTMGLGAGIQLRQVDIGVKYQVGYPGGGAVGYFGIGVAYGFVF
jgi:hypothetical protein